MPAAPNPFIVGLGGTTSPLSTSEFATRAVLAAAGDLGAEVEMFDGAALAMPMYSPGAGRTPAAARLVDALRRADGVVIGSPGYHGSISGLLKNALDYAEDLRSGPRVYFEGRAVGCVVCASGSQAIGTTLMSLRAIVHALRGWPTPMGIGINAADARAFDKNGKCILPAVEKQFAVMAEQIVGFASMKRAAKAGTP